MKRLTDFEECKDAVIDFHNSAAAPIIYKKKADEKEQTIISEVIE